MDFFIRILDGQPHEHPIMGDNLRWALPEIDAVRLATEFAPFTRIDPAGIPVGFYEVLVEEYVWDGPGVRDNWHTRPMTEEEHTIKRQGAIEGTERHRASLLAYSETEKALATTPGAISVWDAYISDLTAHTYADPSTANLPLPPYILPDGSLAGISAPGTAPDVID